jgi:probable rRNA maturation factor
MSDSTNGEQDPGGDPFSLNVSIYDEQQITIAPALLVRVATRVLKALAVPEDAALVVTLVEPERMAELKEQALGERAPTDVLAFPIDDPENPMPGPFVLGDIVICPEVAAEQARAAGHSLDDELAMLLVHGILHCLGRDHATPAEEAAMFAEQAGLLAAVAGGQGE